MKRINLFFNNLSERYEQYLLLNYPYIWNRNYIEKWRYITIAAYIEFIIILISSIIYLIIPENWNVDKFDFFGVLIFLSLFSYIVPLVSAQYPVQFIKRESGYPGLFIERNEYIRLAIGWITYMGYFIPFAILFLYCQAFISPLRNIFPLFLFFSLVSFIRTSLDYFNPPYEHGETIGRLLNKIIAPIIDYLKRYKLTIFIIFFLHLAWVVHDFSIQYKLLPLITEADEVKLVVWDYYNLFFQFLFLISIYALKILFYCHLVIFIVIYLLYFPKAKKKILNQLYSPK